MTNDALARLAAARPSLADLIRIRDGSDPILTTWFMNRATFTREELRYYPYELRRSYVAELASDDDEPDAISDEVHFAAVDDASAWAWLRATYRPESIAGLVERTVTYREVEPPATVRRWCDDHESWCPFSDGHHLPEDGKDYPSTVSIAREAGPMA